MNSGSREEVKKSKKFTDRQMDGQIDRGRQHVIKKANLNLWFSRTKLYYLLMLQNRNC